MIGAYIKADDLPKIKRLEDYGYELEVELKTDGRVYVTVVKTPKKQEE